MAAKPTVPHLGPNQPTPVGDVTATLHGGRASGGTGRLAVRCPGCAQPMDVDVDTSLTDLTCQSCGGQFSLVDHGDETRAAAPLSKLGRFDLLERLGVGGFGTVWKARDKELDRTVALKVPRHADMSSTDREKFFREARAAAQLQHPNIVSVHEVGRDGDSIFIVSDFVRGVTLGDWLTGQRLTTREAAELCAKIADALHHAHEHGIVHRDLKPANIMMDSSGEPHLMDFGLARRDAGEVTLTMDGQVVGTPAYMSPEQASGEGHAADRRSDVYSVGVILFQLLTSELPFRGNSRMLLHQVINEEPPGPRKLNSNVSRDIETITLKCLEKQPAKRYQTAEELAAELRRCLAGEPILARPIGRGARAWRWCRRHPQVAVLSGSLLAVLVAASAVSTWQAIRATRAELLANERLGAEIRARRDANAARTAAEKNLHKALQAVDLMLSEVGEESLADVPQMETVRRSLLEKALAFYQEFLKERSDDPRIRLEAGRAYKRVSDVYYMLGQHVKSEKSLREAIAIFEQLEREFPEAEEYQEETATSYRRLGFMTSWMGSQIADTTGESIEAYEKSIQRLEKLASQRPDEPSYRHELADAYSSLGDRRWRWSENIQAEAAFRRAIELHEALLRGSAQPEYRAALGAHYSGLADVLHQLLRPAEAEAALQEALRFQRGLVADDPVEPQYRRKLALSLQRLSRMLIGKPQEAEASLREGIELQRKLVKDFPNTWDYQWELSRMLVDLGGLLRRSGETEQAKREYANAAEAYLPTVRHRETVARDAPEETGHHVWLTAAYFRLAKLREAAGQFDLAIAAYQNALEARQNRKGAVVGSPAMTHSIATTMMNIGALQLKAGRSDEGAQTYAKAVAMLREIDGDASTDFANPSAWNNLAWAFATAPDDKLRDPQKSVRFAKKAVELQPEEGVYWNTLGVAHYRAGDWQSAIEALNRAVELRKGGDSNDFFFLAMAHFQEGDVEAADQWRDRANHWMDQNDPYNEEFQRFRNEMEDLIGLPAKEKN